MNGVTSSGTSLSFGAFGAGGMFVSITLLGVSDTDTVDTVLSSLTTEALVIGVELDAPVTIVAIDAPIIGVTLDPLAPEINGGTLLALSSPCREIERTTFNL